MTLRSRWKPCPPADGTLDSQGSVVVGRISGNVGHRECAGLGTGDVDRSALTPDREGQIEPADRARIDSEDEAADLRVIARMAEELVAGSKGSDRRDPRRPASRVDMEAASGSRPTDRDRPIDIRAVDRRACA